MDITRNSIEINSSIEAVFAICVDVEKWPEIFPPCQSVRIIRQDKKLQHFEITALADDKPMTWQSERKLDVESRTISSLQTKTSALVKNMQMTWRVDPLKNGVFLSLEHQFEIKDDVQGLVDGVSTPKDAQNFMKKVIHSNSTRELASIKQILESRNIDEKNTLEFQEELFIDSPPESIFAILKNAEGWPKLLPHCISTDILYDDGTNQEFYMSVDVQGKPEKIRTIRRCLVDKFIQYFQPNPPDLLKSHSGEWIMNAETEGGTRVISWHSVTIRPEKIKDILGDLSVEDALELVKNAINSNSMTTMQSIKTYLLNH